MIEKISIGSTGFAQFGSPDYAAKDRIEFQVLHKALMKKFGKRIEQSGGRLIWQKHEHDFGPYHEMEFHIPEEKLNASIWKLINEMESFDWKDVELLYKMQSQFNKLPEIIEQNISMAEKMHEKAIELEEMGAMVILPEDAENFIENRIKILEESKLKNTYQKLDICDYDMETLSDSIVPACCVFGCEVEPDGICPHGNRSILLEYGLI